MKYFSMLMAVVGVIFMLYNWLLVGIDAERIANMVFWAWLSISSSIAVAAYSIMDVVENKTCIMR